VVWDECRLREPPDPSLPSFRRTEGDASQPDRIVALTGTATALT
jgi:hypothetical protein